MNKKKNTVPVDRIGRALWGIGEIFGGKNQQIKIDVGKKWWVR